MVRIDIRRTPSSGEQILSPRSMASIQLDLVYRYRQLVFDREQGKVLDSEQERRIRTIESLFATTASGSDSGDCETPSFGKLDQMSALLRQGPVSQPVRVVAFGLAEAICFCPRDVEVLDGTAIELVFDDDSGSYRFKALVVWSRLDADLEQILGLELYGLPLLLRRGPPSDKTHSIVERILNDAGGR